MTDSTAYQSAIQVRGIDGLVTIVSQAAIQVRGIDGPAPTEDTTYQTTLHARVSSFSPADVFQQALHVRIPLLSLRPVVPQTAIHARLSVKPTLFPIAYQTALQLRTNIPTSVSAFQSPLQARFSLSPLFQPNRRGLAQPEHAVNGIELDGEALNESRAWADIRPEFHTSSVVYRPFVHLPDSDVFEEACIVDEDRSAVVLAEDRSVALDAKGDCK